jgi:hypothetical protein
VLIVGRRSLSASDVDRLARELIAQHGPRAVHVAVERINDSIDRSDVAARDFGRRGFMRYVNISALLMSIWRTRFFLAGRGTIAFLLTGGQVADCTAADGLLDRLLAAEILDGEKGYDSDAVRRKIESNGLRPTPAQNQSRAEELLLTLALSSP